ncbi:hypothetical protein OESDEN_09360 [Oesophagostomum dentatum]|uniref:Uncharacterized protein n=1 Tax=Oesophagostomum dentatum TaxID=61180 RepID=A0A0B1T5W3_OESDE|nr:hypothetical protein OESDEN_09360 [Oesophagostomum dentatum]
MDSSEAAPKPGARWDPASYELNDFDFNELTEMFAEIRTGCGQNFSKYFGLLKSFVKLSITNCELDIHARKLLSDELMSVHERFPVKTRSLDDILGGGETSSEEKQYLPHISTLNALVIIYSLGCGWNAPDRKIGEVLADAVHTMLKDRIDAALSVRNTPLTNEIGIHARYQPSSLDTGQSTSTDLALTATDFLKSFSSKNHFLADESMRLLRLRSHANFYKRLKSVVPEQEWDAALEKSLRDAVLEKSLPNNLAEGQNPSESASKQSSSTESSIADGCNETEPEIGTTGSQKTVKRPNSGRPQPAKRKREDLSSNSAADTSSISNAVADVDWNG